MGRSRTFSGSNVSSNPHHPDFKGFKLIPNVRLGQDIVQLDEDHYLSIVSRAVNGPSRSFTVPGEGPYYCEAQARVRQGSARDGP